MRQFKKGLIDGLPILLGYITVSFTFGLTVTKSGIPGWLAVLMSATNLTSAGQFAGANLIVAGARFAEIALTVFVINIRYMLMSLSLSQKILPETGLCKRLIMSFGVTDEVFAVAAVRQEPLTFSYMLGLIAGPFFGWTFGTWLGTAVNTILPPSLEAPMGIALYAMFIAIILPPAKKSRPVAAVLVIAAVLSCMFTAIPAITSGWAIIICAVAASVLGAVLFPRREDAADDCA